MSDLNIKVGLHRLKSDLVWAKGAKEIITKAGFSDVASYIEMAEAEVRATEKDLADPWRAAKTCVVIYESSFNDNQRLVAKYVRHLEGEIVGSNETNDEMHGEWLVAQEKIKELEAELAKRPVVWCSKHKDGWYARHTGLNRIALFPSPPSQILLSSPDNWIHEPYTGNQE